MVTILYIKSKIIYFSLLLCLAVKIGYGQNPNHYFRYIDSADVYISQTSAKAQLFLDSIPKPLTNTINGSEGYYYLIQGLIHGINHEDAKAFQSFLLSLKHAEINKDYEIAGDACIQAFRSFFPKINDKSIFKYLEKAKYYYELCDNKYGIYEIELIDAYIKTINQDFVGSNKILLNNLSKYKDVVNEDAYLYADANTQLTINYILLDSIEKAHSYFNELKTIKNNPTVTVDNYKSFVGLLNVELATYYLENEKIDSTIYYLEKTKKYLRYLDDSYVILYFNTSIDAYHFNKNYDLEKKYLDSLKIYENTLLENNIEATIQIGDSIQRVESELREENDKLYFNKFLTFVLIVVLVSLSFIYLNLYRKNKLKLNKASNEVNKLKYLKSNNEKLALKVQGLEDYISNLKNEVKEISILDESCQRARIKEFYTNLHHDSATLIDKSENHIELVNDLNVDFFKQLEEKYPELNKSEITICYYLFIGFNNKEIAVFLNSSVRGIESKRYRITKKMNLKNTTLINHLKITF